MTLEIYSLEIEENLVYLCFGLGDEQQQQHPMPETEKIWNSQHQYYEVNLTMKLSHIISEVRKITLQIWLFMIFMFHLMLWKTLHMILTP